jgi:hypothetical protein
MYLVVRLSDDVQTYSRRRVEYKMYGLTTAGYTLHENPPIIDAFREINVAYAVHSI